mmetsp:Transcript_129076/g.257714  ORF Transcript_129076/g.257714 Transcript_129076/m.257714 type:complete len:223 (-) Transcript_129076:1607-2275(-)
MAPSSKGSGASDNGGAVYRASASPAAPPATPGSANNEPKNVKSTGLSRPLLPRSSAATRATTSFPSVWHASSARWITSGGRPSPQMGRRADASLPRSVSEASCATSANASLREDASNLLCASMRRTTAATSSEPGRAKASNAAAAYLQGSLRTSSPAETMSDAASSASLARSKAWPRRSSTPRNRTAATPPATRNSQVSKWPSKYDWKSSSSHIGFCRMLAK